MANKKEKENRISPPSPFPLPPSPLVLRSSFILQPSSLIYLDYNASTPLAPEVFDAMTPYFRQHFGNPSGDHWAGRPAREAIQTARRQVADLLGSGPEEIVFCSGGSEANNNALKGVFYRTNGPVHLITSSVEHPAIVAPCRFLESQGAQVTIVGVDGTGRVDPEDIRKAITPHTRLISVMHANNEVGTIQPIREICRIAHEHGILMHTDAAQSVGKLSVRVDDLEVDLLSVAGHKMYAPKGIGVLYVKKGVDLEPLVHGAGHESGRRAGTENTAYITGMGAACQLAHDWVEKPDIGNLRDHFWDRLHGHFGDRVVLNGHPTRRLPNTLNLNFVGRVGKEILAKLEGVAASTGSACHAGSVQLSPVLKAMGIAPEVGMGAIRFSLGRSTTREQIEVVADHLITVLG